MPHTSTGLTMSDNPWEGLTPPYRTILAAPPWPYNSTGAHLRATKEHRPNSWDWKDNNPGAGARYNTMTMADLEAMPVVDIADKNAHLYLWVTNSFLVEAHRLARAWGFKPKTLLTSVKTSPNDPTRVSFRTGYYFRGATEHVLFAVRGSQPLLTKKPYPTAYLWPRTSAHSVKPDAFMDVVEQVSPGPFVELFARRKRLGWAGWGDEYGAAS